MEAMIQIVGMTMEDFWSEMDRRYGKKSEVVEDKEYNTKEAMQVVGYTDHRYFKKYLERNGILPYRKARNQKFYRHSQLFKQQKYI